MRYNLYTGKYSPVDDTVWWTCTCLIFLYPQYRVLPAPGKSFPLLPSVMTPPKMTSVLTLSSWMDLPALNLIKQKSTHVNTYKHLYTFLVTNFHCSPSWLFHPYCYVESLVFLLLLTVNVFHLKILSYTLMAVVNVSSFGLLWRNLPWTLLHIIHVFWWKYSFLLDI